MEFRGKEQLEFLCAATGLGVEELSRELEVCLLRVDGLSIPEKHTYDSFWGNDYKGISIAAWSTNGQLIEVCSTIAHKFKVSLNLLKDFTANVASLVMMGDGDCPHCGHSDYEVIVKKGMEVGGYHVPRDFIGTVHCKCSNCNLDFNLSS